MFSSLNSDTRKAVKAHSPSEKREETWLVTVHNGPARAACFYKCVCIKLFLACAYFGACISENTKIWIFRLLTFTWEEFLKGLFPPEAFFQGWPKNRWRKVRFNAELQVSTQWWSMWNELVIIDSTECVMLTYFALFCSQVDSSWVFATCFPALLSAPLPCEEKKTG